MDNGKSVSQVFAVLYVVGIGLLVLGFMLLVPPGSRNDVAWLDFIVVCIIYSINFPVIATWRLRGRNFSQKIPGIAILLVADPIYVVLALGVAVCGLVYGLSFRLQLVLQLALIFGSVVVVAVGWMASVRVKEVADEEQSKLESLQRLKQSLVLCEVAMASLEPVWNRERMLVRKLKEDSRYLSPCAEAAVTSHEEEMIALLQDICLLVESNDPIRLKSDLHSQIEKCERLMAYRQRALIQQGEQG